MESLIIGIAGGSGSGKSTFTNRIKEHFGDDVVVLYHDNYYRRQDGIPFEQRVTVNYDHPDSLETELLVEHLKLLKQGKSIDCPVYDYSQHNRSDKILHITPSPVILVEGILLLADPRVRELLDIKVYVEADADERILRRISRDVEERGRDLNGIINQYLNTVKPMHYLYVEPTRSKADIVINSGKNDVAFDLFASKISMELEKRKLERRIEDIHREGRRADRDVARALAHGVCRDHASAGIALRRCHQRARLQLARRVEQPCAFLRQLADRLAGAQRLRQDVGELPRIALDLVEAAKRFHHRSVVRARLFVNREHARGIADAEHLLTAELPVHIAGQRRQERDILDMLFPIEDGLIEMRDAPALRDVKAEELRELGSGLTRDVIAPGPERSELFARLVERQVAVHHGTDANRADCLDLHVVAALHISRQAVKRVLDAEPDLCEVVRPDAVLQLILPAVARRSQRLARFIDQNHLYVRRTELEAEGCAARLNCFGIFL